MTNSNLADRYAAIKAEIVGDNNIVTVTLSEPVRFDATAAKAFLTADQIAACTKVGELVTTIRVKAVKNAKVLA
jgi:hypothetical protein